MSVYTNLTMMLLHRRHGKTHLSFLHKIMATETRAQSSKRKSGTDGKKTENNSEKKQHLHICSALAADWSARLNMQPETWHVTLTVFLEKCSSRLRIQPVADLEGGRAGSAPPPWATDWRRHSQYSWYVTTVLFYGDAIAIFISSST